MQLTIPPTQALVAKDNDIAKIHAEIAVRKENERGNLLRLSSKIDAVASKVQTAVTMRQVTGNMANVVRGMDLAMKSMDLEKVRRYYPFPLQIHTGVIWMAS